MPPSGVAALTVGFDDAHEPPRGELFLAGTERVLHQAATPQVAAEGPVPAARRFGIASPRDGSIFALNPDIPPGAQHVVFEGEPGRWMLDGAPIGASGATRVRWTLWPGKHRLALHRRDGSLAQTIEFEVRGAVLHTLPTMDGKVEAASSD